LIYDKEKYNFKLLWKPLEIDFGILKNEKIKMNDLIYWTYEEIIKKEVFEINLLKNKEDFVLKFDKINYKDFTSMDLPNKFVKSISITSCSSNSSQIYDKEYTLTADENWNYKYNISEKLNNKCDIPYKINVYYEDGSIETGEYYVLFDY